MLQKHTQESGFWCYMFIIIEDAYGGSSPHSHTACVCDCSRSRGRHKCRHPRKAKSAYLQNMHICKSCVSAQPEYLQNLTEHLRKKTEQLRTFIEFSWFWRVWGPLGQTLPKSSKMYLISRQVTFTFGVHFRPLLPKCGHQKIGCFSDPAFSAQNRPRAPQREYSSRSGAQRAAEMDVKIVIVWGPAKKLKFERRTSGSMV